jgi:hypothetical protein
VPHLFLRAGAIRAGGQVLDLARRLPAQIKVTVAGGLPDEIGRAVADCTSLYPHGLRPVFRLEAHPN